MNILQLQERLRDLPDNALMQEMQMPTGNAPQFLVLSELKRRKRMRDEYQRQQNADMPTVAEEVVTAAGMPQEGIMGAARAMAPQTNVAQNTGMDQAAQMPATRAPQPQMMADGGVVRMQQGGLSSFIPDRAMLLGEGGYNRGTGRATVVDGVTVELLPDGRVVSATTGDTVPQELAAKAIAKLSPNLTADKAAFTEFEGTPSIYRPEAGMPTQEDLDRKYLEQSLGIPDIRAGESAFGVGAVNTDVSAFMPSQISAGPSLQTPTQISQPDVTERDYGGTNLITPEVYPTTPDTVSYSEAGLDPIQVKINQLKAITQSDAPIEEKARAANELERLQEDLAVNLYGGNIGVTAEGQGTPIPEGMVMTGMGLQRDPNYQAPGKTGNSIVDQAANQGTEALTELGRSGVVSQDIIDQAMPAARLADFEKDIYPINKDMMDIQNLMDSPYLSEADRASANQRIAELAKTKEDLAVTSGVNTLFTPTDAEAVPTMGGFEGLIDVTPPASPAEQAAAAAEEAAAQAEMFPEGTDAGITAAGKALKAAEQARTTPKPKTDPDGAGFGSLDSRIAKMLADRQKQAESDKWMALAYAGMEMMKPTATVGEGLGKAGQAGLAYLTKSKQGLQDFETDMLKLQAQLDIARTRAAGSGSTKMAPASLVTAAASRLSTAQSNLENAGSVPAARQAALDEYNAALTEYNNLRDFVASQYGYTPSGSTGAGSSVVNLGDSANK